jgi:hypothetical protein
LPFDSIFISSFTKLCTEEDTSSSNHLNINKGVGMPNSRVEDRDMGTNRRRLRSMGTTNTVAATLVNREWNDVENFGADRNVRIVGDWKSESI